MRRSSADVDAGPTLRDLQRVLTSQKADLRASQAKRDEAYERKLQRALLKQENPALRRSPQSVSAPVIGLEANSSWATGSSYSFGKPTHRKGNYRIEVVQPRHPEYNEASRKGGFVVPGPGQYESTCPDGPREGDDSAMALTGGWMATQHDVFMATLKESAGEATPEFFRLLKQRLPKVPRWELCDHLRWYANQERTSAKSLRRAVKWRLEHTRGIDSSVTSTDEKKDIFQEAKKLERLLRAADEEEQLGPGGRPRGVAMQNQQRNDLREVLDQNLGGHPEFRKSPGYTFGVSHTLRDPWVKQFTENRARSSSSLDNPGPGRYCGLDEKLSLTRTMPSWSLRSRVGVDRKGTTCTGAGPGYLGKLEGTGGELAWRRHHQDLHVIQDTKPTWTFGREAQRFEKASSESRVLTDSRTPDELGPGRYIGRGASGST